METAAGSKILSIVLAATLVISISLATPGIAQDRFYLIDLNSRTATELGSLGGGVTVAQPPNDLGQVTGYASSLSFITGPDGVGMTALDSVGGTYTYANAINNTGQVVGSSDIFASRAFITGPNGAGMRGLGTLGGPTSNAAGINDAGQVVGWSTTEVEALRAFMTGPNGTGMKDLGTLGGDASAAHDMNEAGQVVGFSTTSDPDGSFHAFITSPGGGDMRDLGGGAAFAAAINNAGRVVGYFSMSGGVQRVFITGPDGEGIKELLGDLGSIYSVHDINDAGQVVGDFHVFPGVSHAFITGPDGEGMIDLNSLVDLPGGVILTNALGINNVGQVVVVGVIPEPESYAMFLAGLGLIGLIARRGRLFA